MVRAPGARGGCQRRSCWPRRTGCRSPRRGNASYLLHSFPHTTPPLPRRRKCGRGTNSSSRSVWVFFFFFQECTTFPAHREGAWRELEKAVGLLSRFTPGQKLAGASRPPSPGVRGDAGPAICSVASRPSSSKAAAATGRAGASERGKGVPLPAQGQRCGLRRVRPSPPRLH